MSEEKKASYYQVERAYNNMLDGVKDLIVENSEAEFSGLRVALRHLQQNKDDFLRDIRDWAW